MFVVDITFQGNHSAAETVFVRRPFVTVGPSDEYHLAIPEMLSTKVSLEVSRDVGRRFSVAAHSTDEHNEPTFLGGTYDGSAQVELGDIALNITALDLDLLLKEQEALDKAGIRILRRAYGEYVATYPAIRVHEPFAASVSLWPNQSLTIGRSRTCGLRIDAPTVSMQHARVGYESGSFWIEDLGSTNGTFVGDEQISGRKSFAAGERVYVSKAVCLYGLVSEDGGVRSVMEHGDSESHLLEGVSSYPALVSMSEVARPSRLSLQAGRDLKIGRDPGCGLWLGAPHVSRQHCIVSVSTTGRVLIKDSSTNGTAFDGGLLANGETFETHNRPVVLNFGAGVTVGVCFSKEDEQRFTESKGDASVFLGAVENELEEAPEPSRASKPRERRNTTWFNLDAVVLNDSESSVGLQTKITSILRGLTPYGRLAVGVLFLGFLAIFLLLGGMLFSGLSW